MEVRILPPSPGLRPLFMREWRNGKRTDQESRPKGIQLLTSNAINLVTNWVSYRLRVRLVTVMGKH